MEERRLRVFENRVLRRITGEKKDEVIREWRTRHNEELNDRYSSPNIVRVIKSRRMRRAQNAEKIQFSPQREHSASPLESKIRVTVAVYCKNHTKHEHNVRTKYRDSEC
jgi:hypothetical protein